MSIHPSIPLKTPSLAVSMCSGDGGTRRGRGDSDIGPSELLTAIEKEMREKGPPKRYATIDTETWGGGEGGGSPELNSKI